MLWANATFEEEETAPSLKEGIQMVRCNVELEASLIDDLLDVARITGGKLQLHLQLSDAATLFRDCWHSRQIGVSPRPIIVHSGS